MQVEYEFPPSVPISKECRDLLCRILVAEPSRRITIPEIQRHPWYRTVRTGGPEAASCRLHVQLAAATFPADPALPAVVQACAAACSRARPGAHAARLSSLPGVLSPAPRVQDLPPALDTFNDNCIRNQQRNPSAGHGDKIQEIVNQAKVRALPGPAAPLVCRPGSHPAWRAVLWQRAARRCGAA